MDQTLIPLPDKLPVNWLWFHILLILTFLLHLVLMNFILGGSLLTMWDAFRGKNIRKDAHSIPTLIALTINFGVPPLLFVQVLYGNLFYTSSLIMAVPWILVIPALILVYYGAYIFVFKYESKPRLANASLVISSLLMLIVAFIYVNNITLSMTPAHFDKYFVNSKGFNLNLSEPSLIPRYLHYIVASVAVAGLGRAIYYHFSKGQEEEEKKKMVGKNLKIFSYATMAQVIVGLIFWLTLPKTVSRLLVGGNTVFSALFLLGIILAILVIFLSSRSKLMQTIYVLIPVLLIMVLVRDFVRRSYLSGIFSPSGLEVNSQPGSLVLFLVVFLVGLASLYYMISLMTEKTKSDEL